MAEGGFDVPLKCSPEEYKHFVEPAMHEAQNSNFPSALDIVENGLNAHPASEGHGNYFFDEGFTDAISHCTWRKAASTSR